ncbi:serine O-acetyltransferase [Intestinibacter sp.]
MKESLKSIIEDDIYRYFGTKKIPLKEKILRKEVGLKYIILYRKANYYYNSNNLILKIYYALRLLAASKKTHFQIMPRNKIGRGFYIGHWGRVIINPDAVLGKNINISTGVVIGQENRGQRKGVPTIGDEVWIGANAIIVGNIKIGNDVLIAPNTYINKDIPSHSIVVGNPARIISRENACESYIENTVD